MSPTPAHPLNPVVEQVTTTITERSQVSRERYLSLMRQQAETKPHRSKLSCTNLAHTFAASEDDEKVILKQLHSNANIGIVTAYNDMLSAHQPLKDYPELIKQALLPLGHTAQVAGGVPAMCDGITQGQAGMELSLFSRDTIALAAAVGLSHNVFDGILCLGVCDKIVPGLLMAALRFGHLPCIFVPAGPMPSGISNSEKAKTRQKFAEGKATNEELLDSETKSYHSPGTCTFYGTANTNQMLMEAMGLHLPDSAFCAPDSALRHAFVQRAATRVSEITGLTEHYTPVADVVCERSIVNAMVTLLATGGSTNLIIHLTAIARCAGIHITLDDFDRLSDVVPLITRVYPNGQADINQFHHAGGTSRVIYELLSAGLVHEDVKTVAGQGLKAYAKKAELVNDHISYHPAGTGTDKEIIRTVADPFAPMGGIKRLKGNLGDAIIKVSAVPEEHWHIHAPARIFHDQGDFIQAFQDGQMTGDFVAVVRFQGPKANGMPELHKLMPLLGVLQDRGQKVALVTDGRLSGASGKVPAALHVCPEAMQLGAISQIEEGDMVELNCHTGELNVTSSDLSTRPFAQPPAGHATGIGRELFSVFRHSVGPTSQGAISIQWEEQG
ncbi:phosphogluconate dehydratase [Litoribrevibacter albus]|uniref:Phosphogluconate dehydratase n=1 Tax=Litoribrevibacter albus TaxID=1473156 RepID=A0AA37W6S4_9GAMM|nr:phosphogluconate dehydratase [Litoribrevibacter albus]GLQ30523.1 phosphogluconate dehydratase [Litoribrevibacter albus]